MAGTPSRAVQHGSLQTVLKLEAGFAPRQGLSCSLCGPLVPALYRSVLGEREKGWTQTN